MANEEHLSILRQGVEVWNKWRGQNPGVVKVDLREANLRGADLMGAKLVRADLMGAKLVRADLRIADLRRANLVRADLRVASLDEADLMGANLEGANLGGVNLKRANLGGVNLERAYLGGVNLERAYLGGVNLKRAKLGGVNLERANLERAKLGEAYLEGANLEGANLEGAKLGRVNLREANLREANLVGANLERVNLYVAQALQANFENATLTGACIHDWHINADTNFEGVVCEYIYLICDEESQQLKERRPHVGTFAPGEFTKLFQLQNVLKTAEISFPDGIDWQAFLKSLQKLQAKVNSEDLSIQAIEKKAGEAFVVRLEVPADADKEKIEEEIKREYEVERKLLEVQYRAELNAKDREIEIYRQQSANLWELAKLGASRPITIEAKAMAGDTYNQSNMGIGHMSGGEIKDRAKVAGTLNEAEQRNLAEAAAEIEQLLTQLSQTYPTETTSDKMMVAAEVMKRVESNPSLRQKLVRAVKEGGTAALEASLNHPVASFVINATKSFVENSQ